MTTSKYKFSIITLVVILLATVVFSVALQCGVAFADYSTAVQDDAIYVTFYINEDNVYEKVEVVDGYYMIPSSNPTLEGYTFSGWSDGFTFLNSDTNYYTSSDSLEIYAVWQEVSEDITYGSLTADWLWPVLIVVLVIVLAIFAFFYYWCVVRDTKVSKIIPTIKASIAQKKSK